MSASLAEKAAAKINLTLRVLGRRTDGYHELESLVAFADLADGLSLQPGAVTALDITGPFAGDCGPIAENLVLKAVAALRRRVDGLTAGRLRLEKNIPVAAGLGGGSSDAAAALRLLARSNDLNVDDPRVTEAAREIGADVPVCLVPRARIMRGIGDILSLRLEWPPLAAVLANPGLPLATRDVFAKFTGPQGGKPLMGELPRRPDAIIESLEQYGNDLTQAAVVCLPEIAEVIERLRALPGARLARMSGSGATCFALFASAGEAAAAAGMLQAAHEGWWICPTTIS